MEENVDDEASKDDCTIKAMEFRREITVIRGLVVVKGMHMHLEEGCLRRHELESKSPNTEGQFYHEKTAKH
jgi:hypothetical protein